MNGIILFFKEHKIAISLVLLLVFALIVLFFFFRTPIIHGALNTEEFIQEEWSALTLPQELRGAVFFKSTQQGVFAYTANNFFYVRDQRITPQAFSIARAGSSIASIETEGGVYALRVDGVVEASSTVPFYGLTFSPDANQIFVARSSDILGLPSYLSKTTSFIIDPSKFQTVRYDRVPAANAKERPLLPAALQGPGIPLLVTNDHMLLRLADGGIIRTDAMTGAGSLILPLRFDSIRMPVLLSPDHTLLSWTDTASRAISVYRLSGATLQKVATINGIIPGRYVLGNSALYELRAGTSGVEVWQHSLDGSDQAKKVHTFPKQINIVGMTL